MSSKGKSHIARLLVFVMLMLTFTACEKDYSYEGGGMSPLPPPPVQPDSASLPAPVFLPPCNACEIDPTTDSTWWNLVFDGKTMCGGVTRAIVTADKTGFTFFGPSKCSPDTGLVMSVALNNDTLNRSKSNIVSRNVALEYYDNTTQTNFFESMRQSITFTIASYDHSTKYARGTFQGEVKLKDSTVSAILNGNFYFKIDR